MKRELNIAKQRIRDNVVGVFDARRKKGRMWTDERSIQFHVHKKLPASDLSPDDLIPREIDGIRTDVVEASPILSVAGNKRAAIQGGLSIGIEDQEDAGTLGLVMVDASGNAYGITSGHVLLVEGEASFTLGDYVVHPSISDGGSIGTDRVGEPHAHGLGSDVDVGSFTVDYPYGLSIYNTEVIPPDSREGSVGDVCRKFGRTTGLTEGRINGSGFISLDYSDYGGGSILMELVYFVATDGSGSTIATNGDSGALWFSPGDKKGVGLHTAHTTTGIAYAVPFSSALSYVGFTPSYADPGDGESKGSAQLVIPIYHEVKGSMNLSGSSERLVTRVTAITQDTSEGYDTIEEILNAAGIEIITS